MKAFAAFTAFLLGTTLACAQDPAASFPSRTIRIFGQGTGSTADYLSRYVAQKLTGRWGQPVIVDSRAGAGGTIPTDVVAKSPPDGYNLVMGHIGPMVSAVTLYANNLPYDPVRDFEPVTMVGQGVVVLVTNPALPVSTAREFIAYAKDKGNLAYSSAGNGSTSHLTGELLKRITGVPLQHIPYKSAGNALTAMLTGEVQVSFLSPLTAHAQLKAGKVKALAVSSSTRFAGSPEIPSAAEAGIAGMDVKLWFGLFAGNLSQAGRRGRALHAGGAGRLGEERARALDSDHPGRWNQGGLMNSDLVIPAQAGIQCLCVEAAGSPLARGRRNSSPSPSGRGSG